MIHKRRTFSARLQLSYKEVIKLSLRAEIPERQHFPFEIGDAAYILYYGEPYIIKA